MIRFIDNHMVIYYNDNPSNWFCLGSDGINYENGLFMTPFKNGKFVSQEIRYFIPAGATIVSTPSFNTVLTTLGGDDSIKYTIGYK